MITFTEEHKPLILAGRKWQTRRLGVCRWVPGHDHWLTTDRFDIQKRFARAMITDVHRESLLAVDDRDVHREGYKTREEFIAAFKRINKAPFNDPLVWVVSFRVWLVRCLACGGLGLKRTADGEGYLDEPCEWCESEYPGWSQPFEEGPA